MNSPHVKFRSWFFNVSTTGAAVGNDKLTVKLTNGTQTVVIQEIGFDNLFFPPTWVPSDIDVSTLIPITDEMRILFEVGDNDPNGNDAVEAGIDFFEVYDANPPSNIGDIVQNGISMDAYPNPASHEFNLNYRIINWENDAELQIYNAFGQLVESRSIEVMEGKITVGQSLGNGIYFAKIRNNGETSQLIKLIKQR